MKNTKLLAFHLPQYHEFEENNQWWGKGFTEWTNVKKAKALFKGHNQPREPLGDNYYDLSFYETRIRQAKMAKKYGIYGFCYYHYWFNGKLLMEKPLELLLKEPEIDFPFCLCWANEPWTRAWDGKKDILIQQDYSDFGDWKKHIEYLMKFFKDPRYILKDNKPVLVLYRTESIIRCNDMIEQWREKCKQEGFNGIYIIEEFNTFQKESHSKADAVLFFEPMYTVKFGRNLFERCVGKITAMAKNYYYHTNALWYNYDKIWKHILNREIGKNTIMSAFLDWDNTARRGKYGTIFSGANPEKFKKFFWKLYKNACKKDCDYLFINAWNEWSEGTYLEPDKLYQYGYLEAIKSCIDKINDNL